MKKYLLYSTSNVIFFATLSIAILNRGYVDFIFDLAFLSIFIGSHFLKNLKLYAIVGACILGAFFYPHDLLVIVSLGMSSWLSIEILAELKEEEKTHYKDKASAIFFEKLSNAHLEKLISIQEKLDVFLMQEIQEAPFEEAKIFLDQEPYDESLDLLEQKIALDLNSDLKKQRQPLRRLRRIVMKQTSFFDERNRSEDFDKL